MASAVALAAAGGGLLLRQTRALEALELKSIDTRFALRGTQKPSPSIVVVGIDPQTFSQLQTQWPFPRSLHAKVIERLKRDGAKVIVYDVQFTEPTTPESETLAARAAATAQDNVLIESVRRAGNVVLATSEVGPHGENDIFGGGDILRRIGARAGASLLPPDSDGVDRRIFFSFHGLRALSIVAAEAASGHAIPAAALGGPTAWIDFAGPAGTVPEVSFSSVLDGETPASKFAGKTVVVGATASNLQDVHATPFGGSELMSGPELVANAIATVLDGFPLRSSNASLEILLIVAFGALAPLLGLRLSPGWVLVTGIATFVAYGLVSQLAFDGGRILALCDPFAAEVLGCVGVVAADSFGERRRLQALKRALGTHGGGPQFFISYRRTQSLWPAALLGDALLKRLGRSSVFIDKATIDPGDIWPREIEEASTQCSVMLVLICPGWADLLKSDGTRRLDDPQDWVRREVIAGLENPDALVVPVLHDGANMPEPSDLPDPLKALRDSNAIELSSTELDVQISRLIDSIDNSRMRGYLRHWPSGSRAHP